MSSTIIILARNLRDAKDAIRRQGLNPDHRILKYVTEPRQLQGYDRGLPTLDLQAVRSLYEIAQSRDCKFVTMALVKEYIAAVPG